MGLLCLYLCLLDKALDFQASQFWPKSENTLIWWHTWHTWSQSPLRQARSDGCLTDPSVAHPRGGFPDRRRRSRASVCASELLLQGGCWERLHHSPRRPRLHHDNLAEDL